MTDALIPPHREISSRIFRAIGPARIAVLTIYALRRDDLASPEGRAQAEKAIMRIGKARAMLAEGATAAFEEIQLEEPADLRQSRLSTLKVLDEVWAALSSGEELTSDGTPDREAYRVLCLNRVDPEVTAYVNILIRLLDKEQSVRDEAARANTLRAVGEAKGVGKSIQMVALNAAIVAANSGAEGRGFMVIAEEVRTLSHRTQTILNEVAEGLTS